MDRRSLGHGGRQPDKKMTPEEIQQMRDKREATRKRNREDRKKFADQVRVFKPVVNASDIMHCPMGQNLEKLLTDIVKRKRTLSL